MTDELSLEQILERYYADEQNIGIHCFWNADWTVALGDEANGYKDYGRYLTLAEVKAWLLERMP